MKNLNVVRDVAPDARNDAARFSNAANLRFTPGEFFRDAGTVIVVCLGLGLLMQVLLG